MKYFILFFISLAYITLSGCTQQQQETSQDTSGVLLSGDTETTTTNVISTGATTVIDPITAPQDSSKRSIASGIVYFQTDHFVIISGGMLTYSGFFHIKIPKQLTTWENDSIAGESLLLTNSGATKRLTLIISKGLDANLTEKQLCNHDLSEGVLSKSKRTKVVQGRNLYITNVVFEVAGPDIKPRKFNETQFCFVKNNQVYTFAISDYPRAYMDSIVNSLHFF